MEGDAGSVGIVTHERHLSYELLTVGTPNAGSREESRDQPELEHVESEGGDHIDASLPVLIRPPVWKLRIEHVGIVRIEKMAGEIVVVDPSTSETGTCGRLSLLHGAAHPDY